MARDQITTTQDNDGKEQWRRIDKPRHIRLLNHLFEHGSISRQHADEVAPAANSPAEFMGLRRKGFDLPCKRVSHVTVDGIESWYGRYYLTSEDRLKAAEVLGLTGRKDV